MVLVLLSLNFLCNILLTVVRLFVFFSGWQLYCLFFELLLYHFCILKLYVFNKKKKKKKKKKKQKQKKKKTAINSWTMRKKTDSL